MGKVNWTDESVMFLINAVRDARCIWNPRYRNNHKKNTFWERVVTDLNKRFTFTYTSHTKKTTPAVVASMSDVRKKWGNLRAYFFADYNRMAKVSENGTADEELEGSISTWKYTNAMQFLKDVIPTNTTPGPTTNNDEKAEVITIVSENFEEEMSLEGNLANGQDIFSDTTDDSCHASAPPLKKRKKSNGVSANANVCNCICSTSIKLTEALIQKSDTCPKYHKAFANFIAEEMSKLNEELQIKAKSKISTIIWDLQAQQVTATKRTPEKQTSANRTMICKDEIEIEDEILPHI